MIKKYLLSTGILFFCFSVFAQAPNQLNVNVSLLEDCSAGTTTLNAQATTIRQTNSYTVSSINPNSGYATSIPTKISLLTDDQWTGIYNLKLNSAENFNFSFFGNSFSQCLINTNGVISFSVAQQVINGETVGVPGGVYSPNAGSGWALGASQLIPSAPASNAGPLYKNAIHGPFQDLFLDASSDVNIAVMGTYPNRVFVYSSTNVPMYSCNTIRQSSQVILYEGTNIIDVYVIKRDNVCTWNGGNAVIGIQNNDANVGYTPAGRNTGNWSVPSSTPEAWRFAPSGAVITPTYVWRNNLNEIVGSGQSLTVPTDPNQTYTVTAAYSVNGVNYEVSKSQALPSLSGVHSAQDGNDILTCASSDQTATFDLTTNEPVILGSLDPFQFSIDYFSSLADANSDLNAIANPSSYTVTGGQIVYARVTDNFNANPSGCYVIRKFVVGISQTPAGAPTGNADQNFVNGETLTDLEVSGQNIQWYGSLAGNDLLPYTTNLVDGTTYYAAQSNFFGCVANDRLAVTAHIALGSEEFTASSFKAYPNPVTNVLNVFYTSKISSVEIFNMIGQKMISASIDAAQGQVDVSGLNAGTYIVKVTVNEMVKSFKIIKQ